MDKSTKIILGILIATLLGVGGYFYLKMAKKPVQAPVNQAPKVEEIDTSNWQTYRNETLGFEIKMPPEWTKQTEFLGNPVADDRPFWREQVGVVNFTCVSSTYKDCPNLVVRVKDSDIALDEFASEALKYFQFEDFNLAGLSGRRFINDKRTKENGPFYHDYLVLKDAKRYYYFEFSASRDDFEKSVSEWNTVLDSFSSLIK